MLVLVLVLVLVAPVTFHALRRSRFLVPPCHCASIPSPVVADAASKMDVIRIFANSGTKDHGSLEPCKLVIQNDARVGPGGGRPVGQLDR